MQLPRPIFGLDTAYVEYLYEAEKMTNPGIKASPHDGYFRCSKKLHDLTRLAGCIPILNIIVGIYHMKIAKNNLNYIEKFPQTYPDRKAAQNQWKEFHEKLFLLGAAEFCLGPLLLIPHLIATLSNSLKKPASETFVI